MKERERPILFSAPMVRAILAGTKTQTRRIFKGTAEFKGPYNPDYLEQHRGAAGWKSICPYGVPGDRLWVRENGWQRPIRAVHEMREGADTWDGYYYDADGLTENDHSDFKKWGFKRRASIHMPRWASRITIEITDVRVQRLLDITPQDALAEGIEHSTMNDPRVEFQWLWDSINAKRTPWASNPWVWVLSFRRI